MQNFHYSSISNRMHLARSTADSRHRTRKYSSYIACGVWWSDSLRCKILDKKLLSKCGFSDRWKVLTVMTMTRRSSSFQLKIKPGIHHQQKLVSEHKMEFLLSTLTSPTMKEAFILKFLNENLQNILSCCTPEKSRFFSCYLAR